MVGSADDRKPAQLHLRSQYHRTWQALATAMKDEDLTEKVMESGTKLHQAANVPKKAAVACRMEPRMCISISRLNH